MGGFFVVGGVVFAGGIGVDVDLDHFGEGVQDCVTGLLGELVRSFEGDVAGQ